MAEARDCVERIDELLAAPSLSEESFTGYVQHNGRFHDLLAEMAGSDMVRRQLERAKTLPFASPNGFVLARSTGPDARDALVVAQAQHRARARSHPAARRRARRKPDARARAHRPRATCARRWPTTAPGCRCPAPA